MMSVFLKVDLVSKVDMVKSSGCCDAQKYQRYQCLKSSPPESINRHGETSDLPPLFHLILDMVWFGHKLKDILLSLLSGEL